MPDHHRLTRYIVYVNGTAFMGMLRQNSTHPELFGPDFDCTHGPYVLAAEADAEIDRLRAEIERLTRELSSEKALRAEAEDFAEDRERHTALVARGGAEIIAERDRLRAALLNHVCNCGPTDPDPSVHREDCAYRLALSGEHASAHETTARRMTRAEADAMNRAFWRSVEIIDDIDDREEVAPGDARYYRPSENPSICPYGQSDCETTRGGVCQCAMPAEQASDGRD